MKESASISSEDIAGLRVEVIKHETGLTGCRRDLDKLRTEYNSSFSGLDYKLENLDNKVYFYLLRWQRLNVIYSFLLS